MNRVIGVLRKTIFYATLITTAGFLAGELVPRLIVRIFTPDETLTDLAVYGMRITVMFFPLVGFQMVVSNFFQSIGMAKKAIFLSLTRQVIFLIPFLLILPHFWGITGVWASLPAADFVAFVVAAIMLVSQIRKFKAQYALLTAEK